MLPENTVKTIREKVQSRRKDKPISEELSSKQKNLKKEIARFATALGVKVLGSKGDQLVKLNTAITLLNQAQMIVEVSENEAKKLFAIARSLKSVNEVKDERRKEGSKRRLNETRKKNTDR